MLDTPNILNAAMARRFAGKESLVALRRNIGVTSEPTRHPAPTKARKPIARNSTKQSA
jgi:hypothetical protein